MIRPHLPKIVIGLVIVLVLAGLASLLTRSKQSRLYLDVPSVVSASQQFTVPLKVDTAGQAINAAEVSIHFDPKKLQVVSVNKDNSFFQLWIDNQPSFSNDTGDITFAGGIPTPGFTGAGTIGSVTFQPKLPGATQLTYDEKSRMLLNDGVGTAVTLLLAPTQLVIK
jgi:hypothetical protein